MKRSDLPAKVQSLTADDFFYFFLQLRKPRIRAVVARLRELRPSETAEQQAQRVIDSHANLSFLAGSLLHIPMVLPGVGSILKLVGLAASVSVLTRMHLYMILEIALLYGKDIDDPDRVPEMMAVVAATGGAVAAPPLIIKLLPVPPIVALPAAGLTATALTRLIGKMAIRHYSGESAAATETTSPEPAPESVK